MQRYVVRRFVLAALFGAGVFVGQTLTESEYANERETIALLQLDTQALPDGESASAVAIDCSLPTVVCVDMSARYVNGYPGNGCSAEDEYRRADGQCIHVDQIQRNAG